MHAAAASQPAAQPAQQIVLAQTQNEALADTASAVQAATAAQTFQTKSTTSGKTEGADLANTKKDWCVKEMTKTFFAKKDAKVAPLDQFNQFVNAICPSLDLRVPSKYRIFGQDAFIDSPYDYILTILFFLRWRYCELLLPHRIFPPPLPSPHC